MVRIVTFVFLDLETSGFPQEECNKTKITELSLIAVKRCHILETGKGSSPRVQQKLTLCLNPRRMVYPGSTTVTGLCNELLELEPPFDRDVFNTINSFLSLLSKPVCLISHNGMTFDFPILRRHLIDLGVSFSEDLLCADSLYGFYDILKKTNYENEDQKKEITTQQQDAMCYKTQKGVNSTDEVDLSLKEETQQDIQKQNETTPSKSTSSINQMWTPRKEEVTKRPNRIGKVRRKIFFGDDSKPEKSYKVKYLYERVLKKPCIEAHRAENDCLMVLECVVAKAREFSEWVDDNHCLFSDVPPMTVGMRLGY